jgi:mRNA interferase HigB
MRIVSKKAIVVFYKEHAEAKEALEEWFVKTRKADWETFHEVKETFNSADAVGNDRYVFNIKGNKLRLVGLILFNSKIVFIRFVGTHSDYDKINASNI